MVGAPTSSIRQGDVLRVLPGERVPVDGEILDGRCSLDESMLTGESALVNKGKGSQASPHPQAEHSCLSHLILKLWKERSALQRHEGTQAWAWLSCQMRSSENRHSLMLDSGQLLQHDRSRRHL